MFFKKREKNCEVLELEEDDKSEHTIGHTASSIGNYVVFIGGIVDEDETSSIIASVFRGTRIYDLVEEEWIHPKFQNVEKIENRYFHTSIVHEEVVYVFGGKSQKYFHNDVFTLNIRNFVFTNITNVVGEPPTPRYGHTSVCNNTLMFVYGGYCRNGFTHNDLHSFEFKTNTWRKFRTEVLPRRYFHSSVLFKNDMYIINGKTKDSKPLDDIHKINLTTMKSTKINITKPSKNRKGIIPTWGQCAFTYNKKIYCFGGIGKVKNIKTVVKTLREYDFEKKVCEEIPFLEDSSHDIIGYAFGTVSIWRNYKLVLLGGLREQQKPQKITKTKKQRNTGEPKKFHRLIDLLPDEMIREILSFCDHVILSRLHSCSRTHRFSGFSCEDQFWKHKIEEVGKLGIPKLSITPELLRGVFSSPKEYKRQLINVYRRYFEFCKHNYCHEKKYIGFISRNKQNNKKQYLRMLESSHHYIRVLVLGDDTSGKSQLIHRMAYGTFLTEYIPGGMGMNNMVNMMIPITQLSSKEIKKKGKKGLAKDNKSSLVEMELFDFVGSEDYFRLRPLSYFQLKDTVNVALVCFSMVNRRTFDNVRKWISEIQFFCPFTPMILLGLQSDLIGCKYNFHHEGGEVEEKEVEELAKKFGFQFWNITSAKTGYGIHRGFLESIVMCERLRRDKEFMDEYYVPKYQKLLVDELAKESVFGGDYQPRYKQTRYSFKLVANKIKM